MNILNVFSGDAASVSIPLTMVMLVLNGWFLIQLLRKKLKKGGAVKYTPNGPVTDSGKVSLLKQGQFIYMLITTALWVLALVAVNNDYRPYNPKKDGVPRVQTDSTRISADSMVHLQEQANHK